MWLINVDPQAKVRVCKLCKANLDLENLQLFRVRVLIKQTRFLGLSRARNFYVKAYVHQVHRQDRKTPICNRSLCTKTGEASWSDLQRDSSSGFSYGAASRDLVTPVSVQSLMAQGIDSSRETHGLVTPQGIALEFFMDHRCEDLVLELWEKAVLSDTFTGTCTVSFSSGALDMPENITPDTRLQWNFNKKLRPRTCADTAVQGHLEFEVSMRLPISYKYDVHQRLPVARAHGASAALAERVPQRL